MPGGAPLAEPRSLDLVAENITTIVWATGYRLRFGWITVPVFDTSGRPTQKRGCTSDPDLFFLGLHWMHTIKSGLLSGVGDDAEYLARHIQQQP